MFIVITAESDFENEIAQIKQLFALGLEVLHVRKPFFSKGEMRQWLDFFPSEMHKKMVLHKHHELEGEFKLKGIHLTEKKRAETESKKWGEIENWKRKKLTLSASFHQQKEVEHQMMYDYAFLSPVFTSVSKKGYEGKQFRLSATQRPVIALGGISEKTLPLTPKMGYAGVAVLGSIWNEGNPIGQFKNLQKTYEDVYG